MADFAKAEFALSMVGQDGFSQRDHLEAAYKASGYKIEPEQLANKPPFPPDAAQLWAFFQPLHASRGSNGFGPLRITARDILCESDLLCVTLEPWEVQAIRRLDEVYFEVWAEHQKKG